MGNRILQLHYHPAMKQVLFKNERGKIVEPSQLHRYFADNKFILQLQGNDFFNDIAKSLDGSSEIELQFFGTSEDFSDLAVIADYYNNSQRPVEEKPQKRVCRFSYKHIGKLPSMSVLYDETATFGKKAMEQFRGKLRKVQQEKGAPNIRKTFCQELENYVKHIENKIKRLESTDINICFVGVYSAGKSTLINALLGYKILPEDNESTTAKIFVITAPKENEEPEITFEILGEPSVVKWIRGNGENGYLSLTGSENGSNEARRKINDNIQKNVTLRQHEQFYNLLDCLNCLKIHGTDRDAIGTRIDVKFPIPLNVAFFNFTIYDTPGTGSNNEDHGDILQKALKDQSHSIVVFVAAIGKLEGEGNSVLLKFLSDNKKCIDLDRSFFVINRADTTDPRRLEKYYSETLKLRESKSKTKASTEQSDSSELNIELKDKRLFFTSASQAYAAKAMCGGYAGKAEERLLRTPDSIIEDRYCMYNRHGASEAATDLAKKEAENALSKAENDYDKAYVATGLYSLASAIHEYGKKYAIATKANALIVAVEDILNKLRAAAEGHRKSCGEEIERLEKDLTVIKKHLAGDIDSAYIKHNVKKSKNPVELDEETTKKLGIDLDSNTEIITQIEEDVSRELDSVERSVLDRLLGLNKEIVETEQVSTYTITKIVNDRINRFINAFNEKQLTVLEEKLDAFKKEILATIEKYGELTGEAKIALRKGLDKPIDLEGIDYAAEIQKALLGSIEQVKYLCFFSYEGINVQSFLRNVRKSVREVLAVKGQEFTKEFLVNLDRALTFIHDLFGKNIEEYSGSIQDIKNNKQEVLVMAEEIDDTASELGKLSDELSSLVWKGESA